MHFPLEAQETRLDRDGAVRLGSKCVAKAAGVLDYRSILPFVCERIRLHKIDISEKLDVFHIEVASMCFQLCPPGVTPGKGLAPSTCTRLFVKCLHGIRMRCFTASRRIFSKRSRHVCACPTAPSMLEFSSARDTQQALELIGACMCRCYASAR